MAQMYQQTGQRVVLVTGPSGAGRSTAINVLEDLGYEAIDNLPLSLMPRLLQGPPMEKPLALGLDVRNRDFSTQSVIEMIDQLSAAPDIALEVLYLDATTDVLLRRYSETRRRHPMAPGESPSHGIEREFDLLAPIRARAEMLIDTSDLSPHDLRAEVERWFTPESGDRLALAVHSFSYKRGLPRGIDMAFDCRFLNNPYWEESLRSLNGKDKAVSDYVQNDPRFDEFFERVSGLAEMLLPAYVAEGKSHLSIGFGCTGGQHRSVAVAEKLAATLESAGWQVSIRHRELERAAATRSAPQRKESEA